jgi:type VII secretion integral membrane protein EccD
MTSASPSRREPVGQAAAAVTRPVRVTVMSSTRRIDLVAPGAVPVAELVPELARSVGLLDAMTVHGGYRLVSQHGRVLCPSSGLRAQGIEDGGVLTVAAGVEDEAPRVYDDVVEAMADAVRRDLEPWDEATGRQVALWAGVALLAMAMGALLLLRGSPLAAAVGLVVAVLLLVGALTVSRVQGDAAAALPLALLGIGCAAAAALMLARGASFPGAPFAGGGAGALVAGSLAALGLGRCRTLFLPPMVVGGVFLGTGLLARACSFSAAAGVTTVLAVVMMAGSAVPWLSLAATRTGVDHLLSAGEATPDPDRFDADRIDRGALDPERIARDARAAHETLIALSATVGVLLVVVAPLAVSLGPAGTLVSVLGCAVVMLRTRQLHSAAQVLTGLVSGLLGLMATTLSVLWMHPTWRPGATGALLAAGAALLVRSRLPAGMVVRRGRLGDLAESAALSRSRRHSWRRSASSPRSGAERPWPPSEIWSRRSPSYGAGSSPPSSPGQPATVRPNGGVTAGQPWSAWRWPCC